MGKVNYYYSSVTGNLEMKKQQQRIEMILDSKKIDYERIDIAADDGAKAKMRELVGDPKALPPQICNGDQYCGDFEKFEAAVESEELEAFLKLC
ncbi:SH3 domain-binding glutamic acid-rich-like protein 3 [Corythoichthys intestinalis]|uniref:SH3 domain-binding glutamic acid-rich-like protein 3 n=1 Tax=Corythoichthys intestinalis TaxID=161448 RepID=UPI0025A4F8BD|nr:SH3 domain-binding glutamic acid-rich-like protein 3 [Corythoichthys intestinalis]XP_061806379.1 SH3 domain-binding glutamic acid-rich-like protein 3 [Nerophis lumbriciformis]